VSAGAATAAPRFDRCADLRARLDPTGASGSSRDSPDLVREIAAVVIGVVIGIGVVIVGGHQGVLLGRVGFGSFQMVFAHGPAPRCVTRPLYRA